VGNSTEEYSTNFQYVNVGYDAGDFDDYFELEKSSGSAFDANPSEAQNVLLDKDQSLETKLDSGERKDKQSEGDISPCFLYL